MRNRPPCTSPHRARLYQYSAGRRLFSSNQPRAVLSKQSALHHPTTVLRFIERLVSSDVGTNNGAKKHLKLTTLPSTQSKASNLSNPTQKSPYHRRIQNDSRSAHRQVLHGPANPLQALSNPSIPHYWHIFELGTNKTQVVVASSQPTSSISSSSMATKS